MPDIRIETNLPERRELRSFLEARFPQYEFEDYGKRSVVACTKEKSGSIVQIRKKGVNLDYFYPSRGGRMVWYLSLIVFGVLLPLIWYGFARLKRMKALRKELLEAIEAEYCS